MTRWGQLSPNAPQAEYAACASRFIVNHSGRRSGKTEIAKRKLVHRALMFHAFPDGKFFATAPVQHQAESIYWADLKALVPKELVRSVSESQCQIHLLNGAMIGVAGMDKPERIEGSPIDGILLDEYANMHRDVWTEHVRPALSTPGRPGWAIFVGVPEGRNHFYDLCQRANGMPDWSVFHWPSHIIVDAAEIESAKRDMDVLTFRQEYGGEFVSFEGRAYYAFDPELNVLEVNYDPALCLDVCFDFNVDPGVALITQEQRYHGPRQDIAPSVTACLAEIYIEKNSNTERVCAALCQAWGGHVGEVRLFGDASGGARKTSAVAGSDWDLIRQALTPVYGDRFAVLVPRANPPERVRINAVNSRLLSADGKIKMVVSPKCPRLIKDLEGVSLMADGSGMLDKKSDRNLTHISDALGYKIAKMFPVRGGEAWASSPLQL